MPVMCSGKGMEASFSGLREKENIMSTSQTQISLTLQFNPGFTIFPKIELALDFEHRANN